MINKIITVLTIAFLLLNASTTLLFAETVEIPVSEDTYIDANSPNTDFGTATDGYVYSNPITGEATEMVVLKGDLGFGTTLPKTAIITDAKLQLYGQGSQDQNVSAYYKNVTNWPAPVTYNTIDINGYTFLSILNISSSAHTVTVSFYNKSLDSHPDSVSLLLKDASNDDFEYSTFSLNETTDVAKRPKLLVDYRLPETELKVKAKQLTLKPGQPVEINGLLLPRGENDQVLARVRINLQEKTSSKNSKTIYQQKQKAVWKTVAKSRTNSSGRFKFKYRPKKTSIFRVFFAGNNNYQKTTSKSFKVKVKS